ncbi:MAG: T9SS type A sorting domain-containing protein [Ignavibacteriae bacterium]|nr:T9SS type A sorting domain-containing protein [Ignavibacteriota bacterium]
MFKIKYFIINIILLLNVIQANGNTDKLELGTAVYCDLTYSEWINWLDLGQHWHSGVFQYFEYLPSSGNGRITYSIMAPYQPFSCEDCSQNRYTYEYYINPNSPGYGLSNLVYNFKEWFNLGEGTTGYNGAYSINNISAQVRASIVNTTNSLGTASIDYNWSDMLDVNNVWCSTHLWWCEHWNGNISNIDELRCDGVVEYSYEKNGVLVSKTYSDCKHTPNNDNIGYPSQTNVDKHNSLHDQGYYCGELCPRIQAGEDHSGSGKSRSYMVPLISANPVISNFSRTQLNNKIQLNLYFGDNASIKSYVLIEIKKLNESTWRILKDENNNIWKFKAVDLTNWNGSIQSDNFYIPWNGKYEGGTYTAGTSDFNIRITAIDQGANYSTSTNSFSGTIQAFRTNISGPDYLKNKEKGTWTAVPLNGSGNYTYAWYKSTNGGSTWSGMLSTSNTFQTTMLFDDFLLKCYVTDTQTNQVVSATILVQYDDGSVPLPKEQSENYPNNKVRVPTSTALEQNYPNPFNPTTTIKYQLKESSFVSLIIYNILGEEIVTLVNKYQNAGYFSVDFHSNNLPSGIYICKLSTSRGSYIQKMLLAK